MRAGGEQREIATARPRRRRRRRRVPCRTLETRPPPTRSRSREQGRRMPTAVHSDRHFSPLFNPLPIPFPPPPTLFSSPTFPRERYSTITRLYCKMFVLREIFFLKNANSKLETRFAREKGEDWNSPCEDLSKREKRGGKEERGDGKKRKEKERRASGSKTRIDRLSSILRGIF